MINTTGKIELQQCAEWNGTRYTSPHRMCSIVSVDYYAEVRVW